MRKVMVSERGYCDGKHKVTEKGIAKFHQWGQEVEEGETGFASYSVAIIEFDDGRIDTARPHDIKFLPE